LRPARAQASHPAGHPAHGAGADLPAAPAHPAHRRLRVRAGRRERHRHRPGRPPGAGDHLVPPVRGDRHHVRGHRHVHVHRVCGPPGAPDPDRGAVLRGRGRHDRPVCAAAVAGVFHRGQVDRGEAGGPGHRRRLRPAVRPGTATETGAGGLDPRRPDQIFSPPTAVVAAGSTAGVFKGRLVIISGTSSNGSTGLFVYTNAPGPGTLVASIASTSGTDPYGNAYTGPGLGVYGTAGNVFEIFLGSVGGVPELEFFTKATFEQTPANFASEVTGSGAAA